MYVLENSKGCNITNSVIHEVRVNRFVQGSIHQGSEVFSENSRGRQCVANAILSCVFKHVSARSLIEWTGDDIDSILHKGDVLYQRTRTVCSSVYLEPSEVPNYICFDGQKVKWSTTAIYSGDIGISFKDNGDFYSLESALAHCLGYISHKGILICNNRAIAVHYCDPYFHVFDSHSRDTDGKTCSDGAASIFSVQSFTQLHKLLRQMFGLNENCAFDLHNVQTWTIAMKKVFLQQNHSKKICFSKERVANTQKCHSCQLILPRKKSSLIEKFHTLVKSGPNYVCKCCTQLWFREGVRIASGVPERMRVRCNLLETDWVCNTCCRHLKSNKIPPCSIINGLKFPVKPPELDLTALEERLVAPRIPFMQLREKPRGGQLSIVGNVVNVPADVTSTIKKLPRLLTEDETISLKFKRSLSFKHSVAFERIRPSKVILAAKWLVENSELFQNEGIQINDDWLCSQQFDQDEMANESCAPSDINNVNNSNDVIDSWTEDQNINDRPTGNMDTVMQSVDFRDFNEVLSVAPGEKNSPLGIFQDKNSEFLSFPTIYCGQTRLDNNSRLVPLHYSTICKWELRNVDRRSATCIPNIFFKMKKLQIKQIQDKVMLAVRKGKKYTVSQMLDPIFTEKLVHLNEGYQVLRTLRESPPYWERTKKDIFAMIRQLGLPTWFCSFSAAETKWTALLITLGKLIENKEYSEEEASNLTWEQKSKLIKADPVTCARYFDYRFQRFMTEVLSNSSHPAGEVVDYFYRIEFQQRGSPHVHMLLWIKNAPNINDCENKVTEFIDKYLTCSKDGAHSFLVNYQTHRHARTCMKKNKPICRFNFPLPPMPHTVILSPIENENIQLSAKKNYEKITSFLNSEEMKETHLSFDEFLSKLEMDFDTYILAFRVSLQQSKVFLKRLPNESRINPYNSTLLKCWLANMDIQFILDPYACAAYIVSYISKGQRGMSNLLHQACEEAKRRDSNIRQQVRRIGNQFLTHVEVGAQEAAYLVLQMPLRRTSRSVVFINTSMPEERVVMLKPKHVLEEMKKDSTDIEFGNIVNLYQQRPNVIATLCLADFVSKFNVKYKNKKENVSLLDDDLPELEYEEDTSDYQPIDSEEFELAQSYVFRNGIEIVQRKRPNIETDSEKYYRELLMLFSPWKNENDLIKTFASYEECYLSCKDIVEQNRRQYEHGALATNEMENILLSTDDDLNMDCVAPGNEHQEQIDQDEGVTLSTQYGCFDPGKDAPVYDVGVDLGISRKQIGHEELSQCEELEDTQYRLLVRGLNQQQKEFFYHVLHWLKTKDEPLYMFLTGGAGVGKSVLTRALYQGLLKYYSHQLTANPDTLKILLCAPTGKAAHNIDGTTIHSAFCIPASQGFKYKPLDMQQLNSMRTRYMHLKVIFIDEISMVGRGMFNFINMRLQEIKGCKLPFGGVSIVAVGDLFQLRPVMDGWIFSQPMNDYGPFATHFWKEKFKMFELTEVMRQKDDMEFAHLLNRLREGNHSENDVDILKKHVANDSSEFEFIPHLFTTRKEVEEYNGKVFQNAVDSPKVVIHAIDWVIGNASHEVKMNILMRVSKDSSKTMGLPEQLKLAINVPAEITTNVNVKDGVTNGSSCVIKKFDFRVHDSSRVSIIWVDFEDKKIGKNLRVEFAHLYCPGIEKNWTSILEIYRMFTIKYNGSFHVKRKQFPIHLAAARTIHKAQGSTLQNAVIHFGSRKNDHMHYVGLSRVTHIQNLHILHLNAANISVSSSVLEEMERLRFEANTDLSTERLASHPLSTTKIVFFNIRSLHLHFDDLQKDYNLLSSDILALSETRLMNSDNDELYHLPGFSLYRYDFDEINHQRPVYGLALYIKDSVTIRNVKRTCIERIQFFSVDVACSCQWVTFTFTYLPPKLTLHKAREVLNNFVTDFSVPMLIAGDTHFDKQTSPGFHRYMLEGLGLQYLETLTSSTDYGLTLDQAFTNIALDEIHKWGTLESYYSDHKPLFVSLK